MQDRLTVDICCIFRLRRAWEASALAAGCMVLATANLSWVVCWNLIVAWALAPLPLEANSEHHSHPVLSTLSRTLLVITLLSG